MVKEELELKHKEQDQWKQKVVVSNTHFQVNTKQPTKADQLNKHKNMLEEEPKKVGFRLSNKRLRDTVER